MGTRLAVAVFSQFEFVTNRQRALPSFTHAYIIHRFSNRITTVVCLLTEEYKDSDRSRRCGSQSAIAASVESAKVAIVIHPKHRSYIREPEPDGIRPVARSVKL